MKKVLFVAIVAVVAISCRKDRTCECKTTSDEPGYVSSTTSYTHKETKKRDASIMCQSYSSKMTAPVTGTYSYGQDCELK